MKRRAVISRGGGEGRIGASNRGKRGEKNVLFWKKRSFCRRVKNEERKRKARSRINLGKTRRFRQQKGKRRLALGRSVHRRNDTEGSAAIYSKKGRPRLLGTGKKTARGPLKKGMRGRRGKRGGEKRKENS